MAPILIHRRDLLKFGLLFIFIATSVFSGGFLFGYESANTSYQAGGEVKSLALPYYAVADSEFEPRSPKVIAAGAEIDVDDPDAKSTAVIAKSHPPILVDEKVTDEILVVAESSIKDTVATDNVSTDKGLSLIAKKVEDVSKSVRAAEMMNNVSNVTARDLPADAITLDKKEPVVLSSLTAEELNAINYSIQIGMYGRLNNAEKKMKVLQQSNVDAYISTYLNKKNETLYNVRFGYYPDKKSALAALRKYKNIEDSDGYLVKFAIESIVNLASLEEVESSASVRENESEIAPASSAMAVDKISQTESLNPVDNISTNSL